ncbi:DinB family protein [Streptomyces sp. NBC_01268]|uniref:DinB family protein n=1 Tax=unclassified Streptomyces TaxID=2593676 RepID=UPI002E30C6FE|nr:DinB family protein [Streptomyces sp. NBC_01268]
MAIPPRLAPLLDQFEFARERLVNRLNGPVTDSGDGTGVPVGPITDAEFLWEPVEGCWSVRRREDGPGHRATVLAGTGDWGRDAAPYPHPEPAPFTTIAWRLSHLAEMFTLRTDHTAGGHRLTRDDFRSHGDAAAAVADFERAAEAWRTMLLSLDDGVLDKIGYSSYPHGSDPEDPLLEVIWWMNQELLHHGAEIALLRDLYRARGAGA